LVAIPLASKTDPAKRDVVTLETLVNLYASRSPSGARSDFYLTRTPGFSVWSLNASDLCRGLFDADSYALGVFGSTLFRFNASGLPTSIAGSIAGTRDIRWSQNNATDRETAIVTGGTAYQYNGTALSAISGDLPANPIDTICINGITLMLFADRRVFYSPVNDANSYGALDFFTVPGTGELRAGMVLGNQIVFFGQDDFYIFRHVAEDADDPFQLIQGSSKPFGCINTFANCNVGGLACFVDQYGVPRVIGQGYLPESIASEGVQASIAVLADKSTIRLWGYVAGDRGFLVLWSGDFCWVYDFKEKRWHKRQSYQRNTWQAKYYMRFAEKDLIAPDQSGGVFYLTDQILRENGEHLIAETNTPPNTNFPNGGTIHTIDLDIEVGTGLDASNPEEDQEPQITMQISVDGGKTFGTGRVASLGRRGQWRKRVTWNRCGSFGREGFIIRFVLSAAVPVAFMNLSANIEQRAA
jgi:hypothetical protein